MNKLGYKQKGIPMLKSPLNIDGVTGVGGSKTDADRLAKYNADKKIERAQDRENTATRNEAIKGIFKGVFTKGTGVGSGSRNKRKSASGGKLNESNKNSVSTNSGSLSLNTDSKLGNRRAEIGNLVSQVKTTIPGGSDTLPPPPPKVKTSFKDAYAKRDMKTYGNLSQAEYTTEAKRQLKGGKVPGSQMEGGNAAKVVKTKVIKNKISDETSSSFTGGGEQPGFEKEKKKKATEKKPAAKIKSNKDIRKEKRANIKGGMSRQEARLKKAQSKAASAKAKTNKTIKSIDPTKAKSADTGAKQTSAKATRAKAKRLEKRAERLKGRVNASKVSK